MGVEGHGDGDGGVGGGCWLPATWSHNSLPSWWVGEWPAPP